MYEPGYATQAGALGAPVSDSERQLRSIIELAADAIVSTDDTLRIALVNAAAERTFGYSREEMLGQPLDMLLPEGARAHHAEHVESFRRGKESSRAMGTRGRIWGRRRSGELFPAEASISKGEIRGVTHYTAILRDITASVRADEERESLLVAEHAARGAAEAAARRVDFLARAGELLHRSLVSEETFRALSELIVPSLATFCIVDLVDDDGRVSRLHVVHADPATQALADQLRAYPKDQRAFLTRRAIATGEAELIAAVSDELLAERAEDAGHLAVLRALAPASFIVAPLRARGRILGALLLARAAGQRAYDDDDLALVVDLASRASSALDNARLYQEARVAMRAREDVLAVVSHDLRNPLSAIGMCVASLLADRSADPDRVTATLQTMQESVWWAQRLIQDLLDVASVEAGGLSISRSRQDPVLLVSRAAHFFEGIAQERGVTLDVVLPDHLPWVEVDADRILQALGNLLSNAIKFTPAGGRVRIGGAAVDDQVHCFVEDSGPGIPDEDMPHIFDRFWTARRNARVRGTGMGLAIVRGIAEAHGGAVWAERAPDGGARFVLALRAASGARAPDA